MRADDLERATELRDSLRKIDIFINGVAAWGGGITLSFGGYECRLGESLSARQKMEYAIRAERETLIGALVELGVTYDPPP